jgi:hypothetical protein
VAQTLDISKAPRPDAGESIERYTFRAHKALLSDIPDPDERNALIWEAWEHHNGALPEQEIARRSFPSEKFTVSPAHCHFVTHETTAKDGSKRNYDLKSLAKIARQHNGEIRDASAFPAISDGHTPEPDDSNPREPAVLGHAGPYRLGMIGRENPRFALFADEYHRRDSADVLSRKPFRSVELWTFKDGRQRFHPIAAVGAEAPRLLMPAKYTESRDSQFAEYQHEGIDVERYTADAVGLDATVEKYEAGAMAGGSNTFTKPFGGGKREDYATDAPGTTSPDTLRDLMAMIQETPQFRYLTKKMEEEEALAGAGPGSGGMPGQMEPADGLNPDELEGDGLNLGDDLGGDDLDSLNGGMGDEEPPAAAGPPDTSDLDDLTDSPAGEQPDESPTPPKGKKGASKEKHSMAANDQSVVSVERYTQLEKAHGETVEKYTALLKSHETLIDDHKKVLDRVGAIERTSTDQARKAQLEGLAEKYTAINLEDECKKCLYSQGSSMSDEAFKERVGMITDIGESFANSPMIPRGSLPERYTERRSADVEKYEERLSQEAIAYHTEQLAGGKNVPYDVCKAEAKKRLAASNGHAAAIA